MESEKAEGIKKRVMKKLEEKVDKALKSRSKTLWELEEEVQEIKNGIGKELLEEMMGIKKR